MNAQAYAETRSGDHDPTSEEFLAWVALYEQEGGENWDVQEYEGTYFGGDGPGGYRSPEVQFAQDVTDRFAVLPTFVIVNWQATADGLMTDYIAVDVGGGGKAFFR